MDELETRLIKKFKRSRAYRGASTADVANSTVRNILASLSVKMFGKFQDEYVKATLDYFNWECPYTGKKVDDHIENFQIDHIVPQNKDACGLNVLGNLVFCDKTANQKKNQLSAEDFLLVQNVDADKKKELDKYWDDLKIDEDERNRKLKKIREWQKQCGYEPDKIKRKIKKQIAQCYKDAIDIQTKKIDEIVDIAEERPVIVTYPVDANEFKEKLIMKKFARIELYNKEGERVRTLDWKATKFTEKSDVRHNITTQSFWKRRKKGEFIRVVVTVVE